MSASRFSGYSALLCGYKASLEGLWAATQRALWVLREESDAEILQHRFAEFGFKPRKPIPLWIPRRRKLAREEVEEFFIRNQLGPAKWQENLPDPGSETEPEHESPDFESFRVQKLQKEEEEDKALQSFLLHGAPHASERRKRIAAFGAAAHPLMQEPQWFCVFLSL